MQMVYFFRDKETLDPGGGIGDPLMTSIVNGAGTPSRNGPLAIAEAPPSSSASTGTMMQSSSSGGPFTPEFLDNDFPSLDFPSTTWDLEPAWHDTARPNSRQSLTPVSTPTPRYNHTIFVKIIIDDKNNLLCPLNCN